MSDFIVIKDVRLAYPNLKKARSQTGDDGKPGIPKYDATFIIDPKSAEGAENIAAIKRAAIASAKAKWPEQYESILRMLKDQKRLCFGDDPRYDKNGVLRPEFEGMFTLSASRYEDRGAPGLFDAALNPLGDDPKGVIYAGCYVNAKVSIYAWDHPKFGRRIRAELLAVMFRRPGDAFTGGSAADASGFESLATAEAADTSAEGLL